LIYQEGDTQKPANPRRRGNGGGRRGLPAVTAKALIQDGAINRVAVEQGKLLAASNQATSLEAGAIGQ
jgi:hypothetical protein